MDAWRLYTHTHNAIFIAIRITQNGNLFQWFFIIYSIYQFIYERFIKNFNRKNNSMYVMSSSIVTQQQPYRIQTHFTLHLKLFNAIKQFGALEGHPNFSILMNKHIIDEHYIDMYPVPSTCVNDQSILYMLYIETRKHGLRYLKYGENVENEIPENCRRVISISNERIKRYSNCFTASIAYTWVNECLSLIPRIQYIFTFHGMQVLQIELLLYIYKACHMP